MIEPNELEIEEEILRMEEEGRPFVEGDLFIHEYVEDVFLTDNDPED